MDVNTSTLERKNGCMLPWYGAFFLGVVFLMSLVATGLIVYYFAPCREKQVEQGTDTDLQFPTTPATNNFDIRLPKNVVPDLYELWLMPFIWENNFTFYGEVKILINVTEDTDSVTLHALDMEINKNYTSIEEYLVNRKNNSDEIQKIKIVEHKNDTDRQFYVIRTSDKLRKDMQYVVNLKFIGHLNDFMHGFYRSSHTMDNQTRWIAATHFEPTDARRAFPCFDEPAFKARFQINIARPKNMTSISNMPRKGKSTPVSGLNTYEWDHYERTVPMSTYLVAFVVSDFGVRKSKDGSFGVWTRPDAINQALYSLDIGPKILKYYEDYFKIKFPLPKMDLIALPDFSAGAMENWGLITFRETALLYQKEVTTNERKQLVAMVISHELSHQWFGNLVTPSWWTGLWLNEGFASYMEYIGTNAVEPTWRILEQFVVHDLQNVFSIDALKSSHPVSTEVSNPDEINQIFDSITYLKGSSIIRMMDHFLTTSVFKKGLTNYLNDRAYQNAEQDNLWYALTKQAHLDKVLDRNVTVKDIMDTWTLQPGFPVVTVSRNYSDGTITLTQERFLLDNNDTTITSDNKLLWWIPITYTTEKQLNFNNTRPTEWMKAERSIVLNDVDVKPSQWVLFNVQETGYYRVNYDTVNWRMIIKQLHKENFGIISTMNRAQLIDDAFNLARTGKLDYAIALNATSYMVNEIEYLPWKATFTAMYYLNDMLIKTPAYDKFRFYILKLLDNAYKKVGFTDKPQDSQLTVFTRINVLTWACNFGHEHCIMSSVQLFNYWRNTPYPDINNPISSNLRSVIYCTAIREGDEKIWEFAWQRYLAVNVASEKNLLLQALACTKDTWLLYRYLNWAFMENSGIRKQDSIIVFTAIANNIAGQPITFDYLRNQWEYLREYFGLSLSTSIMLDMLQAATSKINTKYELEDLIKFLNEHMDELSNSERTLQQVVEYAKSNIRWFNENYEKIYDWLQKNVTLQLH